MHGSVPPSPPPQAIALDAKQLGATGDGQTDDSLALQTALDTSARQGKRLFIPSGEYIITKPLVVHSRTQIFGLGVIRLQPEAAKHALTTKGFYLLEGDNTSGVTIAGITFDGSLDAWVSSVNSLNRRNAPGGIHISNSKDIVIKNTTIKNCLEGGISITRSENAYIINNIVTNYFGTGILISRTDNAFIRKNTISDGRELYGQFNRTASNAIFTYDLCKGIHITENRIYNQTDVGIELGFQEVGGAVDAIVDNNVIQSRYRLPRMSSKIIGNLDMESSVLITENPKSFTPSGAVVIGDEIITYKKIIGNSIIAAKRGDYHSKKSYHRAGDLVCQAAFPSGIFAVGAKNARITNNKISECLGSGVLLEKGSQGVQVEHNSFINTFRGIRIASDRNPHLATAHIEIRNNRIISRDVGILVDGSNSAERTHQGLRIVGNDVTSYKSAHQSTGIRICGAKFNNLVSGVEVTGNIVKDFSIAMYGRFSHDLKVVGNTFLGCYIPPISTNSFTAGVLQVEESDHVLISSNIFNKSRSQVGAIYVNRCNLVELKLNTAKDPESPSLFLESKTELSNGDFVLKVKKPNQYPIKVGQVLAVESQLLSVINIVGNIIAAKKMLPITAYGSQSTSQALVASILSPFFTLSNATNVREYKNIAGPGYFMSNSTH